MLVTGGAGFIGSHYVRLCRRKRPADVVVNLDLLTYAGNPENLADLHGDPNHIFVHGDIRDRTLVDSLIRKHRLQAIVNFAAETHVDRSIQAPDEFVSTNVMGSLVLAQAAREHQTRMIQVSTDEVYGSLGADGYFSEESPIHPRSPYSASKASADHIVSAFHETFGLDVIVTRCSNNYGPNQFPEKLIPLTILNAIDGAPIPVYGDGLQVRDWIHVEDHCEGVDAALMKGTAGQIYNLGAENERTNIDVIRQILELVGRDEQLIRHITDRPGHDRRYAINASKAHRDLGWSHVANFEEGLKETVEWYRHNSIWCSRVRSGVYRQFYGHQYRELA